MDEVNILTSLLQFAAIDFIPDRLGARLGGTTGLEGLLVTQIVADAENGKMNECTDERKTNDAVLAGSWQ